MPLSPNTALGGYNTYTDSSYRSAGLAFLQGSIVLKTATDFTSDELRLFTLPDGVRPASSLSFNRQLVCVCGSNGQVRLRGIRVDPNGSVYFVNTTGGTDDVMIFLIPGICFPLT